MRYKKPEILNSLLKKKYLCKIAANRAKTSINSHKRSQGPQS